MPGAKFTELAAAVKDVIHGIEMLISGLHRSSHDI